MVNLSLENYHNGHYNLLINFIKINNDKINELVGLGKEVSIYSNDLMKIGINIKNLVVEKVRYIPRAKIVKWMCKGEYKVKEHN